MIPLEVTIQSTPAVNIVGAVEGLEIPTTIQQPQKLLDIPFYRAAPPASNRHVYIDLEVGDDTIIVTFGDNTHPMRRLLACEIVTKFREELGGVLICVTQKPEPKTRVLHALFKTSHQFHVKQ